MSESGNRHQSQVYLVTYSCADLEKVPSGESFGLIIVNAFQVVAGLRYSIGSLVKKIVLVPLEIKVIPTITLL